MNVRKELAELRRMSAGELRRCRAVSASSGLRLW